MRVDRGAGSGGGAPGLGEHLLCAFCYAQRHLLPGQGCDDHTAGLGSEGAGTGSWAWYAIMLAASHPGLSA